jgi:hypothetical protein
MPVSPNEQAAAKRPRSKAKQNAAVENLSIAGVTGRFGPIGLIIYARHYLYAANTVRMPEQEPKTHFTPVQTFLVCRALELGLKAYLSLKGTSLLTLAGGPYAHNLESLLLEAENQDLESIINFPLDQREQIVRASSYYAAKVFEYPALPEAVYAYPLWPTTSVLLDAAEALISALEPPCLVA